MLFVKNIFGILSILSLLGMSSTLKAHTEHEEIQVKSTFQVNENQQLHAVTMVWKYDTASSTDMLGHQKDLTLLSKLLVSDLARFNYFTRFNAGDRRLVTNKISQYKLIEAKDSNNNLALQLTFTLSLNKPISVSSIKTINIDHADPTGRGILFYKSADDIILTNELKSKCRTKLVDKAEFIEGKFPQIATINCGA